MEEKKKPSKPAGPLRLAWPGGGRQKSTLGRPATLVSTSQEASSRTRKRKRDTLLWVDKYAPTTAAQLCVAPKKVKEVRTWLLDSEKLSRLLVFVGSPGVGKSTVIKILGQELGWTVHEWSDSFTTRHYNSGGGGSLGSVDQSNSLESFQEFLDHTGAGFSPLELSLGATKMTNTSDAKSIIVIDEVSTSVCDETRSMKHKRACAKPSSFRVPYT